ncbi:cell wall hydrolase [Bacillus piscicola]|uniref:cell wall hydrolase n=1 Tax=Bacillus piscicola TaxID=1632684 RepID=UPI001F08A388|nr:cell wall hydrolase [Bacillus piscicola]
MRKVMHSWIVLLVAAGVFFTLVPDESKANSDMLQREDRGSTVVPLQQKLINMGYLHTDATGYYGPMTEQAVKEFQRDFSLAADGISGANTLHQLENVRKIAKAVHGEARGESFEGQVAVAAVIRNRLNSSDFPGTVDEVVMQKNAFTAVADGQYDLEPNRTAYQAVKEAWQGWDPSKGSHYYYNPVLATSDWIFTRETTRQIGKHVFAN